MKIAYFTIVVLFVLVACAQTPEYLDVGVIVPLTGPASYYSENYVRGMELAVEEHPQIKLHIRDGELDAKTSVVEFQNLEAVVDPDMYTTVFGLPTHALAPLINETGKQFIYEAYTRNIAQTYLGAWKLNFDTQSSCRELMGFLNEKKTGVLFANIEYTQECLLGIEEDREVSKYIYEYGETDYRTLLLKAEEEGVENLFVMGLENELLNIFRQMIELGIEMDVSCAATSECVTPKIEAQIPSEFLKGTISVDYIPQNITDSEFGRVYLQRYPEASRTEIMNAAAGYDAVKIIAEEFGEHSIPTESHRFSERILKTTQYFYVYEGGWKLMSR